MKFSIAALFLTAVSASSLKSARRLDQAAADNEFDFLNGYNLKLISCEAGVSYANPATGETEASSVIFRLCPSSAECSDDVGKSCKAGYGDYIIGLNTFVQEYLEQKRDEMQSDDALKVEQLGECRQYNADKDSDYADGVFYVGPACSSDGISIRVAMFTDAYCTTLSQDVTFEDISAGISLPYSEGGLVSQYCESCYTVNDNGEAGLNEMCMNTYELSGKCETKMESFHVSGKNEAACNIITALFPKSKRSGGSKVIGWLSFVLVAGGLIGFAFTAMKKETKEVEENFGLMSSMRNSNHAIECVTNNCFNNGE